MRLHLFQLGGDHPGSEVRGRWCLSLMYQVFCTATRPIATHSQQLEIAEREKADFWT